MQTALNELLHLQRTAVGVGAPQRPASAPGTSKTFATHSSTDMPLTSTRDHVTPVEDDARHDTLNQSIETGPWSGILSMTERSRHDANVRTRSGDGVQGQVDTIMTPSGPSRGPSRWAGGPYGHILPMELSSDTTAFPDPVIMGICAEQRALGLYDV